MYSHGIRKTSYWWYQRDSRGLHLRFRPERAEFAMARSLLPITDSLVDEISPAELRAVLDRRARRLLSLTGEQFLAKWNQGEFNTPEWENDPRLGHLSLLIPFLSNGH